MSIEKLTQDNIDKSFKKYEKNKAVSGKIVLINKDGFVLNIGGKKDAFVYNEDICNKEKYKNGDVIIGIIKDTKDENGFVKVSQKEYEILKQNEEEFSTLKIGNIIEVQPTLIVNGGMIAKYHNFNVFIPNSHLEFQHRKDPKYYINKKINVCIIQMETVSKKIVASIKSYKIIEEKELDDAFWSKIDDGIIVDGIIKKTTEFGAFVTVYNRDCLLLNKDVGYFNEKAKEVYKAGDKDKFIVLFHDREKGKVLLGVKQLKDDPRIKLYNKYEIDKNYMGRVVKVFNYGAVIELEQNVRAFLHISDAEYGLLSMHEKYKIGDEILVKIKSKDLENNKISLERKYEYEYEIK